MEDILRIRLLGPVHVERRNMPVRGFESRKALALLGYLAARGQPIPRDHLADLLWPDKSEARGRANLSRVLHNLSTLLPDCLAADRHTLRFQTASPDNPHWLDLDAFEKLSAQGDVTSLEAAVELVRGEFLDGLYLDGCPDFEIWLVAEQERWRGRAVRALDKLVTHHGQRGAYELGLRFARRLLALEPWREETHRHVMRLLAWNGQRGAALAQYESCRRALAEELGVEPGDDTLTLYEQIRSGELAPPPAPSAGQLGVSPAPKSSLGIIRGHALHGRYKLEGELVWGGMGAVYRAHDTLLKRRVAVKVLDQAALDVEGRDRLLREAQIVARLNHANIVTVFDVGEADGTQFIVMEWVEGTTLHGRRPEEFDDVLAIARQVCAALEHAHEHGIVHRDLKPENVIITPDGTAKLMDFGLARSLASRLTDEGILTGTVFYLAPELALGQPFDGRADLYALGVMLYELTTGRLPFTADDPLAVISQHLHAPVVPPRARNPEIPPALDALILRLLSKRPEDRPTAAAEVLEHLAAPDLLDPGAAPARELSVLERIERGRLVGRERELREALALWHQALSGAGRTLIIGGEAGVGKTRLARELVTQAWVSGGRALLGTCYAEGGVPYAPFARILRQALDNGFGDDWGDPTIHQHPVRPAGLRGVRAELVDHPLRPERNGGELVEGLPGFVLADLLVLAPALRLRFPVVEPRPALNDPQAEQHRLAQSLAIFVTALSERRPLLLVVEDLHWADSGTLFLLRHLARRTRRQRVLIVATYREVELDGALPFHTVLLDLDREGLTTRLELRRLSRAQTEELLAVLFDEAITPEFLDGVYGITEGNPFFIEEVCKALVESGKLVYQAGRWHRPSMEELGIPQSIRVAIHARMLVLPVNAQQTLRLAAVLGREFDFDILVQASDLDQEMLIDALEDAEQAQLIEEVSGTRGGRFAFVHGLVPSALVKSTRTLQRRRLHRRAAAALEAVAPDNFAALAHHWDRAGEAKIAGGYMIKAGQRAAYQFANQEALDYFEAALERVEVADDVNLILRQRAKILVSQYRGAEAAHDYERLLESAREIEDPDAELDALLGLAWASYLAALDAQQPDFASRSRQLCEEAYTLARDLGDKARMVRALIATYHFRDLWLDYADQAVANIKEAQALSQEIGDEELLIDTRMAFLPHMSAPERIAVVEGILPTLESRRDLPRLKEAYWVLMFAHLLHGNFEQCVGYCDAGICLAEEIGAFPVQFPTIKAQALMKLGRYAEAWQWLGREVAGVGQHFAHAYKEFGTGVYLLELLAYDRAIRRFESVIEQATRLRRTWLRDEAQVMLAWSRVQLEPADQASLDRIARNLLHLSALRRPAYKGEPARIQAEIALCQGRLNEAVRKAEVACAQTKESGFRPDFVAALEVGSRALLGLGRPEQAITQADMALQMAREMGYRSIVWRLHATKADALELVSRSKAATKAYKAAAAVLCDLADTIPDTDLQRGFLSNARVSSILAAAKERSRERE